MFESAKFIKELLKNNIRKDIEHLSKEILKQMRNIVWTKNIEGPNFFEKHTRTHKIRVLIYRFAPV